MIGAAIAGLVLLAAIGYFGYRRWIEYRIEQDIEEIREQVFQRDGEIHNSERIRTETDKAEKALDMNEHREAQKALSRTKELIDL